MTKNIDYQITLSVLSVIAASISIILLINNKYKIINGNGFITDNNAYKNNLYNRILLALVFTGFLIINYNDYVDALNSNKNTKSHILQVYSSILVVIATLISLYVVYKYQNNLENPDI